MDIHKRIERGLEQAIAFATSTGQPPKLMAALRYSVFPGGARVRPRLCLAVASACGDPNPAATDAAASAIELLHCASLVHDDLPCFDNAALRRGKPATHVVHGTHAFHFEAGRVSYRNRWVRTQRFELEREAGEALFGGLTDMASGDPRTQGVSCAYP